MFSNSYFRNVLAGVSFLVFVAEFSFGIEPSPTLQQQLVKENISNLTRDARE